MSFQTKVHFLCHCSMYPNVHRYTHVGETLKSYRLCGISPWVDGILAVALCNQIESANCPTSWVCSICCSFLGHDLSAVYSRTMCETASTTCKFHVWQYEWEDKQQRWYVSGVLTNSQQSLAARKEDWGDKVLSQVMAWCLVHWTPTHWNQV